MSEAVQRRTACVSCARGGGSDAPAYSEASPTWYRRSGCVLGENGSRPIVDVRFDAPYRQIQNSTCDNWTPTWAMDDVLYTGCDDDGSNFGGIPVNLVSFGKLEQ
jgi:hypothetical protein